MQSGLPKGPRGRATFRVDQSRQIPRFGFGIRNGLQPRLGLGSRLLFEGLRRCRVLRGCLGRRGRRQTWRRGGRPAGRAIVVRRGRRRRAGNTRRACRGSRRRSAIADPTARIASAAGDIRPDHPVSRIRHQSHPAGQGGDGAIGGYRTAGTRIARRYRLAYGRRHRVANGPIACLRHVAAHLWSARYAGRRGHRRRIGYRGRVGRGIGGRSRRAASPIPGPNPIQARTCVALSRKGPNHRHGKARHRRTRMLRGFIFWTPWMGKGVFS